MRFKDLTLGVKIGLLCTLFAVSVAVFAGSEVYINRRLAKNLNHMADVQVPAVRTMTLVDMMHDGLRAVVLNAAWVADSGDEKLIDEAQKEAQEKADNMRKYLKDFEEISVDKEIKNQVADIFPLVQKYTESSLAMVALALKGDKEQFKGVMKGFDQVFSELEESLERLGKLIMEDAEQKRQQSHKMTESDLKISYFLVGGILFLGLISSVTFIRSLSKRLRPLMETVKSISNKNFDTGLSDDAGDEIGLLSRSVAAMATTIKKSLDEVNSALEQAESEKSRTINALAEAETAKTEAIRAKTEAEQSLEKAEKSSRDAAVARQQAEAEKNLAQKAMVAAEEARQQAEHDKKKVDEALREAEKSKQEALKAQENSSKALKEAEHAKKDAENEKAKVEKALSDAEVASMNAHREEEKSRLLMEQQQQFSMELQAKVDKILTIVDLAAEGDLTQFIALTGDQSIDRVGGRLDVFFSNLRLSINKIGESAALLQSAADRVNRINSNLTSKAKLTDMLAKNAVATSQSTLTDINRITDAASVLRESISEIASSSQDAESTANQAVIKTHETAKIINELSLASDEIGAFIKVITSIASQTNLLALNATIEAARAGELGRGFAVVANEVKALAKETGVAAEEIRNKIQSVQLVSRSVSSSILTIRTMIEKMNSQSQSINAAVNAQNITTKEMFELLKNSVEQVKMISSNIDEVLQAAGETSMGTEQLSQEMRGLAVMSQELRQLVGQFKTNQPTANSQAKLKVA